MVLIGVEAVENPYFRCGEMLKTVKKILGGVSTPKTPDQHVWVW